MITVTVEERHKIDEIIKNSSVCYVSMVDLDGMPYVIPMNFGYEGDTVYLHSAQEGRSIVSLEKNPYVCIIFTLGHELVYQNEQVACSYRMKGSSVMCKGKVIFEEDFEEKIKSLNIIMSQYTNRKFTYSDPSVNNVRVWKVEIDSLSMKVFGAPNPKAPAYKARS